MNKPTLKIALATRRLVFYLLNLCFSTLLLNACYHQSVDDTETANSAPVLSENAETTLSSVQTTQPQLPSDDSDAPASSQASSTQTSYANVYLSKAQLVGRDQRFEQPHQQQSMLLMLAQPKAAERQRFREICQAYLRLTQSNEAIGYYVFINLDQAMLKSLPQPNCATLVNVYAFERAQTWLSRYAGNDPTLASASIVLIAEPRENNQSEDKPSPHLMMNLSQLSIEQIQAAIDLWQQELNAAPLLNVDDTEAAQTRLDKFITSTITANTLN